MKTLVRGLLTAVALIVVLAAVGWLALQRKDIPYDSLEAKYDSPASRYMELGGGLRVHYRDEGRHDGPTLVLLHGYSASLQVWEPWVKALADDYRVITLDLPGHGLTRTGQDYAAGREGYETVVDQVTTRLGAKHFTLGGNSMGGGVAWRYATAHPERIDALVLVDAAQHRWNDAVRRLVAVHEGLDVDDDLLAHVGAALTVAEPICGSTTTLC
jgi:pimeloyl-ACP methyl ester carboxylesterase